MATVSDKLLTAQEFSQLPDPPDGSRQELVRGVIVMSPPPRGYHGRCCLNIGFLLEQFVRERNLGMVFCNDTGVITETDPDSVRGPDIAYWSFRRLTQIPKDSYIKEPPDLVVEVLSPGNEWKEIHAKVVEYLTAGVPLVWIVDPETRTVGIYRQPDKGQILHDSALISGEEIIPNFSCQVKDFFRNLPE